MVKQTGGSIFDSITSLFSTKKNEPVASVASYSALSNTEPVQQIENDASLDSNNDTSMEGGKKYKNKKRKLTKKKKLTKKRKPTKKKKPTKKQKK